MTRSSDSDSQDTLASVLVVGDDDTAAGKTARILGEAGFAVALLRSGLAASAAVEHASSELAHVVVVDTQARQVRALQLLHRLRDQVRTRAVTIVALASHPNVSLEVACLEAGADAFIAGDIRPEIIVARITAQVRVAERIARIHKTAVRDELTGIHNRRGTMIALHAELDRSRRSGRGLSALLLDVDAFKSINDRYGHQIGDQVLINVASALRGQVRSTDVVGRLGGDEFVVILPEVTEGIVAELARRIRAAVGRVLIAETGEAVRISLGIATHDPGSGRTADELLATADFGMYRDKAARRPAASIASVLAA
jgi:two-component system cell cycle response regulator